MLVTAQAVNLAIAAQNTEVIADNIRLVLYKAFNDWRCRVTIVNMANVSIARPTSRNTNISFNHPLKYLPLRRLRTCSKSSDVRELTQQIAMLRVSRPVGSNLVQAFKVCVK